LQLYTWLGLWEGDVMDIWSMGLAGARPYANLGQPNQLATLILWGLLACLWVYLMGRISGATSAFLAAYLLLGLALTQSRMGYLALTILVFASWLWRRLWPSNRLPWVVTALYGYFWVCPWVLQSVNSWLMISQEASVIRMQQQGELRLTAWRFFWHAVTERPWFGYGWTELSRVQLAVSDQFPAAHVIFAHSHNLFLDLAVWNGLPVGILVSAFLIAWLIMQVRAVRRPEDATLFLLLLVVGLHAMVELPLHYAYFLLPAGLVAGMLDIRLGASVLWRTPRWTLLALWLSACLALGLTVRDYLLVESSYNTLRFEQARIGLGKAPIGGPPEVLVLTQMREWFRLARFKRGATSTPEELAWMTEVTLAYPSAGGLYRLALALAGNGRPGEAKNWLGKICKIAPEQECSMFRSAWNAESLKDPRVAAVPWP